MLRGVGLVLFGLSLFCCVYDVLHAFGWPHREDSAWVTTLAAILPALGAGAAALSAQGEFKRLASRSESMQKTLDAQARKLQGKGGATLQTLSAITLNVAEILTTEVRDWQVLVSAKPPSIP